MFGLLMAFVQEMKIMKSFHNFFLKIGLFYNIFLCMLEKKFCHNLI